MINEKLLMKALMESGLDDSEDKWLLNFVRDIIDKLPKEDDWILCRASSPIENGSYLVTVKTGSEECDLHTDAAIYNVFDGTWETLHDWDEGQGIEVVAWMELPDPYVKKQYKKPKVAIVGNGRRKEAIMRDFEKVE